MATSAIKRDLTVAEKAARKTKKLSIIFLSIMIFLILMFFLDQLIAFIDPAGHNYMIERLKEGEAVDAYLHTPENIISLIWMAVLIVYLAVFLVLVIKQKNTMHVLMLIIGMTLFCGYTLTRLIFCYAKGSTSIIVGMFYTVSFVCSVIMIYLVYRRGIDGDATTPYYVFGIIAFAAYFFACATKSSYSLLNAFAHITNITSTTYTEDQQEIISSHTILDAVYWGGYATTRLYALTFAFVIFGNNNFVFNEEKVIAEANENEAVSGQKEA